MSPDLERKLDLRPAENAMETQTYQTVVLHNLLEGEFETPSDISEEVHPRVYHEMFKDTEYRPVKIDENEMQQLQEILSKNLSGLNSFRNMFFQQGYNAKDVDIDVDNPRGEHWLTDSKASYEDIPVIGDLNYGNSKKEADRFYEEAARKIDEEIGEYSIEVI